MTKIDIISGFLGAGKTTLIKKLLKEALQSEKMVLIENEFGEIGIDSGFLKDAGVEIREMNSGCICCSLVGDFSEALQKVIEEYHPERIIIEPSGVGKLSDVILAVQGIQDKVDIELHSLTTVVDAQKCKMYQKNFGEFFNNQISNAHTIVLSRTKMLSIEKLELVVQEVRHQNKQANIITTPWDDIAGEEILRAMEHPKELEEELAAEVEVCPDCGQHHNHEEHHHHDHANCNCGQEHHEHHHADDVFTSWGHESPRKYQRAELENILKKLSSTSSFGIILRAKGMVESDHEWLYFDLVPEEYEIRPGSPTYTGRFCVIGTDLQQQALQELFKVD